MGITSRSPQGTSCMRATALRDTQSCGFPLYICTQVWVVSTPPSPDAGSYCRHKQSGLVKLLTFHIYLVVLGKRVRELPQDQGCPYRRNVNSNFFTHSNVILKIVHMVDV